MPTVSTRTTSRRYAQACACSRTRSPHRRSTTNSHRGRCIPPASSSFGTHTGADPGAQGCWDLVDRRRSVRGGRGTAPERAVIAAARHCEPRITIVEERGDEHLGERGEIRPDDVRKPGAVSAGDVPRTGEELDLLRKRKALRGYDPKAESLDLAFQRRLV